MTRAIIRKAIANLRGRRLQTAILFVIITLAAALLTLAAAVQRTASNPWERTFEQTQGAHIWFATKDSKALAGIGDVDGVVGSAGPYRVVTISPVSRTEVAGSQVPVILQSRPADMLDHLGQLLIVEGRWLADGALEEIVLDRNLAEKAGLSVGDSLTLLRGDRELKAKVVGLAYNPAPLPCPITIGAGVICELGTGVVAYALSESLSQLEPDLDDSVWVHGVRLDDPEAAEYVKTTVMNNLPDGAEIGAITWQSLRDRQVEEIRFNQVVLAVFSVFAFGLVGFILVNLATGQILSEYREIALLKSIGFRSGEISLLYLLTQVATGAVAAFCGIALALPFTPNVIGQAARVLNATEEDVLTLPLLAMVVCVTVLLVALFTLLPAWQAGRTNTAQAIATGYSPTLGRPSLLARLAASLCLPPAVVLGVKDAFARPLRAMLTISVIIVGVIALTFALSVEATIQSALDDPSLFGYLPVDVRVGIPDLPSIFNDSGESTEELKKRIRSFIENSPYVESFISHGSLLAVVEGTEDVLLVHVLGGDLNLVFTPAEGRKVAHSGEVMVSQRAATESGVWVGDELVLLVNDRRILLHIVGIYSEGPGENPAVATTLATLENAGITVNVGSYGLKATSPEVVGQLAAELKQTAGSRAPVTNVRESLIQDVTEVRGLSYSLNFVLLIIVAANVLATATLTVREKYRDLATMKTLGMTPRQVAWSVVAGGTTLCLVAVAIGLPLGLAVNRWLIAFVSRQIGLDQGIAHLPDLYWLAIIVPVSLLVVTVGTLLPARQAGRLSIVEALRME